MKANGFEDIVKESINGNSLKSWAKKMESQDKMTDQIEEMLVITPYRQVRLKLEKKPKEININF